MRLVSKHAQVGYQTPGERPGCRNCAHFEVTRHDSPVIAPRTACTLHDLEVTSGGICNSHKLQRKAGEAELAFLARQRNLLEHQAADLRDVVQAMKEQTQRARQSLAGFDGRTHAISRGRVVPQARERRA
ncbi:hypothetical protein [[Acidovorax] ebreus]|uniref:Uncharacterized protein n=1 Tax=Acidovorax ebreus (strain TPSY) TaxID=535289 RepID=A0A9J9Q5B3_ACIET|nr:hypothetical protein [[Acidovorax] ebreus]ACM32314.1 hypothetical protein Dtpsy_0836 [[Acidovorax] ebreus TPSY]